MDSKFIFTKEMSDKLTKNRCIDIGNGNIVSPAEFERLYSYKFKKYLSGVGRYLLNQKLEDRPYEG